MDRNELAAPPLPTGLLEQWHGCLDAWTSGRRPDALSAASAVAAGVGDLDAVQRDGFSRWLCERLFDRSGAWLGQFGGHLRGPDGEQERPLEYALSLHPLLVDVVVPHLTRSATADGGRDVRWLFQAVTGLSQRLTPAEQASLAAAVVELCGPDRPPLDVLRLAAATDERAGRWLAQFEASDSFNDVLRQGPPA